MSYILYFMILMPVVLLISCQSPDQAGRNTSDANDEIESLFAAYKDYNMRNFPTWATYEGDHRFNGRLTDLSDRAEHARRDSMNSFLAKLLATDRENLTSENQLNYELFQWMIQREQQAERFNYHYQPIGQQDGIHIQFPQIINFQPLDSAVLFDDYIQRLQGFPKQVDDVIANMKKGIQAGLVPPKFIMEKVLEQVHQLAEKETDSIPFMLPVFEDKNKLTVEERNELQKQLTAGIENHIKPAYKKLEKFIDTEYLPACREEAGVWSLPNGKERYEYAIENYTTLPLTADEIFNVGMGEVERITKEMEAIKEKAGFKGSLSEFFTFLRTDPQFYYTNEQELLDGFRDILNEMDKKLPQLFGRLPKARYELKEIEAYRAAAAPQAYYYSAPEDRSRPGYFYVNTYDMPARPKYTMTALALHEAVPGHHLQISIAQELEKMPWFRRDMSVTAFVEGWGLYSESLGYETGMYEDVYQHFGALTFEIWRACRLVVDVGLHHKKWTREEAVKYMMEHTPNSELDIRSEVDRYISWPGQALAYKIGELKIKALRKKAEEALGDKFDITVFHDKVLENGAIPLPLLEQIISQWIETER